MSSMSLAVSAGAVRPPPWRLMPLLLDSTPPTSHARHDFAAVHRFDAQPDQAVVEQQHRAGRDVARQLLVVEADAVFVAKLAVGVEHEGLAALEGDLAERELADADLGPLQIGHDRDLAADRLRRVADQLGALLVIGRGAVREIQAHDVDAGSEHARQHIEAAACGAERRDDLGRSLHDVPGSTPRVSRFRPPAASRISTAGSVLPSRNSRNAPPPVEM